MNSSEKHEQYSEFEKTIKPKEINEETFNSIYKAKRKIHFKGIYDFNYSERIDENGDTIAPIEYSHDIYISNFSMTSFNFIIDTWTSPVASCNMKGKANFSEFNRAIYKDTLGCQATFIFYQDTLVLTTVGCSMNYCGAKGEFGSVFVLKER